jgi:hypothetical protein
MMIVYMLVVFAVGFAVGWWQIYQTRGLNFMAGAPKPNPLEQGDLHGIIADLFRTFRARLEELVPASVHRQMAIDHISEAERNSHAAVPK